MGLVIRGSMAGTVKQEVALELDLGRKWWVLTDTNSGRQILGTQVRPDDQLEESGGVVRWRTKSITLAADQAEQLAQMIAELGKLAPGLRSDPHFGLLPPPRPSSSRSPSQISRDNSLGRTLVLSSWVTGLAALLGVLGILGSLIFAFTPVEECGGLGRCTTERPFVALGLGAAFAVALNTIVLLLVASYVKTRLLFLSAERPGVS